MKSLAQFLGIAVTTLGVASASAACQSPGAHGGKFAALLAVPSPIADDDMDNEEGDDEGGGVVDPVPQDDGSDGIDDTSGDTNGSL